MKYCDECLSVCLDIYQIFCARWHVAYTCGSVLRHVDDRPHRLSAGRGDGSAQRRRSVIYVCLDFFYVKRQNCYFETTEFDKRSLCLVAFFTTNTTFSMVLSHA